MPGEIATAYVRLRPIADTFRSEAQMQVRDSLAKVNSTAGIGGTTAAYRKQALTAKSTAAQVKMAARETAQAQVAAAGVEMRSINEEIHSLNRLARSSKVSASERVAAARLAGEAESKRMVLLGRSTEHAKEKVGGLRDSLKGLAATFGTTIGAIAGFNFIKSVVHSAAAGQKSAEAITAEFGKAGRAVKQWSDTTAAQFGLASGDAESMAAKFGIAYHQIGLGQQRAAQMTIGFEKLATSIAAIRGVDPTTIMGQITGAAYGNVRSLRALGIAVDQTQIKFAAVRLGLIKTTKDAITPAIRAQALYGLATAKLSTYQQQAKAHMGDLANVQLRLSAEWKNAKDTLGTALLPEITKLTKAFADWLEKIQRTGQLQRAVNTAFRVTATAVHSIRIAVETVVRPIKTVVDALGGLKRVALVTGAIFAAWKIGAGIGDLVKGLLAAKKAMLAFDLAADANPIGLVVAAVAALAGGLYLLYTRSATVRRVTKEAWAELKKIAADVAPHVKTALADIRVAITNFVNTAKKAWREWGGSIIAVTKATWTFVKAYFASVWEGIRGAFNIFVGLFKGDWGRAWKGLKEVVKGATDGVVAVFRFMGQTIEAVWMGIWDKIKVDTLRAGAEIIKVASAVIGKLTGFASIFSKLVGGGTVKNPLAGVADTLLAEANAVVAARNRASIAAAAADNKRRATEARTRDRDVPDGTAPGGVTAKAAAKAAAATKAAAIQVKGALADYYAKIAAAKQDLKQLHIDDAIFGKEQAQRVKAASAALAAAVKAGEQQVAQAILSGQALIQSAQKHLQDFLVSSYMATQKDLENHSKQLMDAGKRAIANLKTLGNQLTSDLDKFLAAKGQTNAKVGVGPFGPAVERLRTLMAGGVPSAELHEEAQRLQAELASKPRFTPAQQLAQAKRIVQEHIGLLVQQAQKGQLTVKQLTDRLNGYLKKSGFTYAALVKVVGKAGATQIRTDVARLAEQMHQIELLPPKVQKKLIAQAKAGGGAGIVDIGALIAQQRAEEKARTTKNANTLHDRLKSLTEARDKANARLQKAEEAAKARVARAQKHLGDVNERNQLATQKHHLAEAKTQTRILRRIHTATAAAAAAQKQLNATLVNTTGFPSSAGQNSGKTSKTAKGNAKHGLAGAG